MRGLRNRSTPQNSPAAKSKGTLWLLAITTPIRYLPAGPAWAAAGARCVQAVLCEHGTRVGFWRQFKALMDTNRPVTCTWYGVALMIASQISDQSRTERTKAQDRTST